MGREMKQTGLDYPKLIVFEVTNRCNLRCRMCAQSVRDFKYADMPFEIFEKMRPALEHARDVSLFGWGEPLLHRRFLDMLDLVSQYPPDVFVLTNGMLLDEQIGERFIANRLRYLNFSMDAPEPELYNYIRRGGDFHRVVGNIKRFRAQCEAAGYCPYMRTVAVLMRSNIKLFPDFIRLSADLGMDEVKGVHLIVYDPSFVKESLYFHQELTNRIIDESLELGEKLGIKVNLPDKFGTGHPPSGHKYCHRPWEEFYIQADGRVRACVFSHEIMGDLRTQSFEEIWHGEPFQERRRTVNSANPPAECARCCHYRHMDVDNLAAYLRLDDPVPNTRQADAWKESEEAKRKTVVTVDLTDLKKQYGLELEGVH